MRKILCTGLVMFLSIFGVMAQTNIDKGLATINESSIKGQLEFLASDWTEGRAVGTKGAYLAADYIASVFKMYGIEPLGDEIITRPTRAQIMAGKGLVRESSYFQNFSLLEYEPGEEHSFSVLTTNLNSESSVNFGYKTDFSVRPGSTGLSARAQIVFAGYALTDKEEGYDELKSLDLEGKVVLVFAGFPGHNDKASEAYKKFVPEGRYARYRFERDKIDNLQDKGVAAIILVRGGDDPTLSWAQNSIYPVKGSYYEADERLESYYDVQMSLPEDKLRRNIPIFTVTNRVVNEILSGTEIDFQEFENQAAKEMKPASKELKGKWVEFKTSVKSRVIRARNVLGFIEGEDTENVIVVGAHYDHIGKYNGWIWNGADDNASGTVGVMSIARAVKATGKKPKKSIIFAAWTGEEKGLFGSKYFVRNVPGDKNVLLNLNYDMIGRDSEKDSLKNQASMSYTKVYSKIEEVTKKHLADHNINLDLRYRPSEKPRGGSDHAPFAEQDIPIFYFMAAMHPDYHQPSDELDKINWEKMANIIKLGFLNIWEFANDNSYLITEDDLKSKNK